MLKFLFITTFLLPPGFLFICPSLPHIYYVTVVQEKLNPPRDPYVTHLWLHMRLFPFT